MCVKLSHQKFKIDNLNVYKLSYQFILKKYLNTLRTKEFSEDYIVRNRRELMIFLKYLWSKKVIKLTKVTNEEIFNFINTLEKYSQSTKYNIVSKIRNFFKFMYD